MAQYKTPGVYIVEKDAFPNSVVEVPTAVPVFIGYTETALKGNQSLQKTPTKITSFLEYQKYFGGAPLYDFALTDVTPAAPAAPAAGAAPAPAAPLPAYDLQTSTGKLFTIAPVDKQFLMYNSIRLFYANGGGQCYIYSLGKYDTATPFGSTDPFITAIDALKKEEEPTMVVIPEAINFASIDDCASIQNAMLEHCGNMQSRVAILDVYDGFKDDDAVVSDFRSKITSIRLNYGTAYYPWVNTSVVQATELGFSNFPAANLATLKTIISDEILNKLTLEQKAKQRPGAPAPAAPTIPANIQALINAVDTEKDPDLQVILNNNLLGISQDFKNVLDVVRTKINLLPPSSIMAGVYTKIDNARGVWKAPANVGLISVISPAVNVSHEDQETLNVSLDGKSINAIRSFIGDGVLVWGGRTLAGNSQDWRYINVRRTLIMIEQSIKHAAKAYVFEPNDANTWVSVKSMLNNYLTSKWKEGALVGAKPEDAFQVLLGLGETMTGNDILDGYMNITVLLAVSRPAEFIVITFQQQMQKS